MHDDDKHKHDDRDDTVEDEIRRNRPFGLAEAIGRAGAGNLKGAPPVAPARRVQLAVQALLEASLDDAEGSLRRTILARLEADPPLLARHFDDAPGALAELLDRLLAGPSPLADLVREADARWGRDYGERPRFEQGGPPHPDDPYTEAGVRALLQELRRGL